MDPKKCNHKGTKHTKIIESPFFVIFVSLWLIFLRPCGGMAEDASSQAVHALRVAAERFGSGVQSTLDSSGRLRSLSRYAPPLSVADVRSAELAARSFLAANRDLIKLDTSWTENLVLESEDRSGRYTLLRFRQEWRAIPVFQTNLRVLVTSSREIVEIQFDTISLPQPQIPEVRIPAEEAARLSVQDLESGPSPSRAFAVAAPDGPRRRTVMRFGPHGDEVTAKWVWFPLGDQLRLGWSLDMITADGITYYECVVDAVDGTLLYRNSITDFDYTGRIFDEASPQPSRTPGVLPPNPNPPSLVARKSVSLDGDPVASPQGWVASGSETIGNNVTAREDKAGDNETTLGAASQAIDSNFDFSLELGPGAPSPTEFSDAAITNLFYWCNRMHDYFYALGFSEAAGNFQEDNFGKGGLGNDSLRADAQDGALRTPPNLNNANMSTPNDGSRPRMQMFLWGNTGGPYVDSDFDADVIIHEFSHGVFRRLTPTIGGQQGGAMNEGNSDFWALHYLTPEVASPDGDFVAGGYSRQNFGRGIRSRPYSTNAAVNDLTYSDYGRVRARGYEVHDDGEIWVQAMWELHSRLIKRLGYAEARQRIAQLMIDAMKRSPSNPSFVDMRDSLIGADRANYSGADVNDIWNAFARRGIGFMAATGNGSSLHVLPSHDLPSSTGKVRFFESIYYVGETLRVYVGDDNNLETTASVRIESTGGDRETVALSRSGAVYRAAISSASGVAVPDDGRLQVAPGDTIRAGYRDSDDGTGAARDVTAEARVVAAYSQKSDAGGLPPSQPETPLALRGDDLSRNYQLPFVFPFYHRLVTSVSISTNGLITIGASNSSGGNSPTTLNSFAAIAPLWDNLRTNGTAIAGEDVYVSKPTSDSIRFRWAAETVKRDSTGSLIAGDPANFAVTLYKDGAIEFHYGNGNTGLTPTVGISRGTETLVQIAETHSSTTSISLENADSIRWEFPGLERTTTVIPFFRGSAEVFSGYAAANYGTASADVAFHALNDAGQAIAAGSNPRSVRLAGGTQTAMVGDQIFAVASSAPDRDGWVEVESTTGKAPMFFLYGDAAQTFLDGANVTNRLARDLIFGRMHSGSESFAGKRATSTLYLVNPGTTQARLVIKRYDAAGSVQESVARTLDSKARIASDLTSLFPALSGNVQSGYIRVSSSVDIAGVEVVDLGGSVFMIPAQQGSGATKLYAAQFVSGLVGGVRYFTNVNLVNSSNASLQVSVLLVDNQGKPVTGSGITNPATRILDPGGQLQVQGHTLFNLPDPATGTTFHEGTLVITASGTGILGDVAFGEVSSLRFAASLPLDREPQSEFLFAQVAEGSAGGLQSYFTGVAFYNPNSSDVEVTLEVYSRSAILTGSTNFTLKAGARLSQTLAQLVPGLSQIGGYIRIRTKGGPVSAFGVYGDSSLEFLAAVPAQPLAP